MGYKIEPSECLIFFGVRFLSAEEVEEETDQRVGAAKKHGLSAWSGRRYPPVAAGEPPFFLLIGKWVRYVGFDGHCEASVAFSGLLRDIKTVTAKLAKAGFTETPELWMQCKYD